MTSIDPSEATGERGEAQTERASAGSDGGDESDGRRLSRRSLLVGILAALLALAAGVVLVAKVRLERSRARLVEELLSDADTDASTDSPLEQRFTSDDLDGLPVPVRRYFGTVLSEGQPYVRTVRAEQRGQFRLGDADSAWKPLDATQHYATSPPGFVWDAEIAMVPFVPVSVADRYADGEGSIHASLLGVVTVADADPSPKLNEGALMRYLAEAVWFPTALLPTEGVEWEPIDDDSARATLADGETTVSLTFHFDDQNRIERVVAEDRYRETDNGNFERARWTGYYRDYEERNGMVVPASGEVEWNLPDGDLPYWRADITALDYQPSGGTD